MPHLQRRKTLSKQAGKEDSGTENDLLMIRRNCNLLLLQHYIYYLEYVNKSALKIKIFPPSICYGSYFLIFSSGMQINFHSMSCISPLKRQYWDPMPHMQRRKTPSMTTQVFHFEEFLGQKINPGKSKHTSCFSLVQSFHQIKFQIKVKRIRAFSFISIIIFYCVFTQLALQGRRAVYTCWN